MRTAWLLPTLVACYAPSAPAGAPCAPATAEPRCPVGQVCVVQGGVETCLPPGAIVPDAADGDGGVDGPPGDEDNDGVPTERDVCPDTPDPLQYDEEGDQVGDACDPCPVSANNADGDGDGVGDACDPNPAAGGDKIVLFDGFNQGMPSGWTTIGPWTMAPGAVAVTLDANAEASISSPFTADSTSTVAASFVATTVPIVNLGFGVAHAEPGEGVMCSLRSALGRLVSLIDLDTDDILQSQGYAWAVQTAYTIRQTRRGTRYTCVAIDPPGMALTVEATSDEVPGQVRVHLAARGVSGSFHWVLHVDSP